MALDPPSAEFLAHKGRVATLGIFIIDHFEVCDDEGQPVPKDETEMGGAGTWAMIAARIFLPASHCAMIVDQGDDFPERFISTLQDMGKEMLFLRDREGKTTRALNIYSGRCVGEGHQSFRYLTPELHLTPRDLFLPPSPLTSPRMPEWIHIVCVAERARIIAEEADLIRRGALGGGVGEGWRGNFIWEPLGSACKPEERDDILHTSVRFPVFSPNLLEMQTLLSITPNHPPRRDEAVDAAARFADLVSKKASRADVPAIIVRAGALGSYTLSSGRGWWTPAYWGKDEQFRVVDPTGGGNSYLGGLMAGLLISGGDLRTASIYAATAASFAIEQRGLPRLTREGNSEKWNGDDPWRRLQQMALLAEDQGQDNLA